MPEDLFNKNLVTSNLIEILVIRDETKDHRSKMAKETTLIG